MGEPDGLPSLGSHKVGRDRSDLAAVAASQFTQVYLTLSLTKSYSIHCDNLFNSRERELRCIRYFCFCFSKMELQLTPLGSTIPASNSSAQISSLQTSQLSSQLLTEAGTKPTRPATAGFDSLLPEVGSQSHWKSPVAQLLSSSSSSDAYYTLGIELHFHQCFLTEQLGNSYLTQSCWA